MGRVTRFLATTTALKGASMAWTMWCLYGFDYVPAYSCFYDTSMLGDDNDDIASDTTWKVSRKDQGKAEKLRNRSEAKQKQTQKCVTKTFIAIEIAGTYWLVVWHEEPARPHLNVVRKDLSSGKVAFMVSLFG
jgi:hypothetical protein